MKSLRALLKKEYLEAARTGKIPILALVFVIFGIMNPAVAKLTPWMMEMLSGTMAENGLVITNIRVDAMTSWTQYFKNIPVALIFFVLSFSDIFTREYRSGTLLLILTKGVPRYRVVLAKTVLLLSLWTAGCAISFVITYGYNAYYWDNGIVDHLFFPAAVWWLFGIWTICLIVLFSSLLQNSTSVSLCTGGTVLSAYLLCLLPKVKGYSPAMLMNADSLLAGAEEPAAFMKAVVIAVFLCMACVTISVTMINRKQF